MTGAVGQDPLARVEALSMEGHAELHADVVHHLEKGAAPGAVPGPPPRLLVGRPGAASGRPSCTPMQTVTLTFPHSRQLDRGTTETSVTLAIRVSAASTSVSLASIFAAMHSRQSGWSTINAPIAASLAIS